MASVMLFCGEGGLVEVGIIGSDGLVGARIAIGSLHSPTQITMQVAGPALKLRKSDFLHAYETMPSLRTLVNTHLQRMLFQAERNVACMASHHLEARLCRWILQAQDTLNDEQLKVTHTAIAKALGAQRTSVSLIAHKLKRKGMIEYKRGRIKVLDRQALQHAACGCYQLIRSQFSRESSTQSQTEPRVTSAL